MQSLWILVHPTNARTQWGLMMVLLLGTGIACGITDSSSKPSEVADSLTKQGESSGSSGSSGKEDSDSVVQEPCSIFEQDCPIGQRCVISQWPTDEVLEFLDVDTRCIDLLDMPKAIDEPCEYGDEKGEDNCGLGAYCVTVDREKQKQVCLPFCSSRLDWTCRDPQRACVGGSVVGPMYCLPKCNPVENDCKEPSQACFPSYPTNTDYVCYPVSSSSSFANTFEACTEDRCNAGNQCVHPMMLSGACDEHRSGINVNLDRCCTELCDTRDPNADEKCRALGEELACIPTCRYWLPMQGYEWLGYCANGVNCIDDHCKPDMVEPNYPWCSLSNSLGCGDWLMHGGGSETGESCWCHMPCKMDSDCPIPNTGNSTPRCKPDEGGPSYCVLDCNSQTTCPNGMECLEFGNENTCEWYEELTLSRSECW